MIYRGRVIDGTIVLDDSVRLPEGTAVKVVVVETDQDISGEATARSIEQEIAEVVDRVPAQEWERLPQDLSDHLDHYIYGTEKE
ncbi:MAG: hypothetical protein GXP27_01700 [Planctomycetes bacterium]|nr:hypothetical protein [Planctomycetota bacterium]